MEALQRQKTLAAVKQDDYYKQLIELSEAIGVPQTVWEGRLDKICGQVVTAMQEERRGELLCPSSRMLNFGRG